MTNPQATTTVSKLDFALVEVSQSKTPIYSDKTAFCEKTKRRFDINKTPFYSEQNEEFENQLSARR